MSGIESFKERYPKIYKYVKKNDTVNRRCNRCGGVVIKETFIEDYPYQCLNCDENMYGIETHMGEPHSDEEFLELCNAALISLLDE